MSKPCDDQCKRELKEAEQRRDSKWQSASMSGGPHGSHMHNMNAGMVQQANTAFNNDKNDIYARAAARKAEEDEKKRYDSVPPEQRERWRKEYSKPCTIQ